MVAIPSLLTAFTLAASLEYAARRRGGEGLFSWWNKLPYFNPEDWLFPYLFCGLVIFIFGGITGIVNASYSMNNVVHNTAWVPAHFHLTVAGPIFLGILGGSLLIVTGLLKKPVVSGTMAMIVPYVWMAGTFVFSTGSLYGWPAWRAAAHQPGLDLYESRFTQLSARLVGSSPHGPRGGCIMGLAVLLYFIVLFAAWRLSRMRGLEDAVCIADQRALSRRRRCRGTKFHSLGGGRGFTMCGGLLRAYPRHRENRHYYCAWLQAG